MRILSVAMLILAMAISVSFSNIASAQSNLKSVLKDDLRPLIDFGAPPAEPQALEAPKNAPVVEEIPASMPEPILSTDQTQEVPAFPAKTSQAKKVPTLGAANTASPKTAPRTIISDPLFDLGVMTTDLGIDAANPESGPRVRGVIVDSPAAKAGIRAGDQIVSVGSTATKSSGELAAILGVKMDVSNRVDVTLFRAGARKVLQIDTSANAPAVNQIATSVPNDFAMPAVATVEPQAVPATIPIPESTEQIRPLISEPVAPVRPRLQARPVSTQPQIASPKIAPSPVARPVPIQPPRQSIVSKQNVNAETQPNQQPSVQQQLRQQVRQQQAGPVARPYRVPLATRQMIPQNVYRQQTRVQYVPQRGPQPQRFVVRGQAPVQQRVIVGPRPVQQQRPVVGSNGRLIGNGRIINSALRVIGF